MKVDAGLKFFVFLIIFGVSLVFGGAAARSSPFAAVLICVGGFFAAWLISSSVRMVAQWQRAVVLRLGKFAGLKGPGLFFIIPLVESVSNVVDTRTISSTFRAEQTITADTVPVDVDAVLFWRVFDVEKAVLEVQQYDQSVGWAAQTALRDVIGRSTLADVLSGREKIDAVLKQIIDSRTEPWGVRVESHGLPYVGEKPETIKVWGRRRLSVLARLLPIAEKFTVQLLGSGLPSIWTAHLGDMRFVLGLSGWTTNDWTGRGNLELLSGAFVAYLRTSARILEHLRKQHRSSFDELSRLVETSRPALIGSLHHLSQQGQVIFDFATRQYRFREVMPVALSDSVLGPPSPELAAGIDTYKRGGVWLERREVLPKARQLLIAQVKTEGARVGYRCEAVFDSDGGFSKATCGCDHFRQFRLKKGPCRHLIALKLFENAEILSTDSAKKELLC